MDSHSFYDQKFRSSGLVSNETAVKSAETVLRLHLRLKDQLPSGFLMTGKLVLLLVGASFSLSAGFFAELLHYPHDMGTSFAQS